MDPVENTNVTPEVNQEKVVESSQPQQVVVEAPKASTVAKPATPKIADVAKSKDKMRFVIIAMGQGGGRLGMTLAGVLPNNPVLLAVNTSDQDLAQIPIPEEYKFKIGGELADGAGKNRNRAKAYFKNFAATNVYGKNTTMDALQTFIAYYEEVLFHPTEQTIIMTVFSSDGGTGSGLGPMFTTSLANYMNTCKSFRIGEHEFPIDDVTNEIPRPVVIGLTPKCQISSGVTNLQNNIECFLDIQKAIDAGIGNFFILDNNLPSNIKYSNTEEMFEIINARAAAPWVKFFGVEMNSSLKCMDLQDKINTLRISGCSSFTSLHKENQFNYVIPRGQSVTRTVKMLRNDGDLGTEEKNANNMISSIDVTSVDVTPIFFEVEKSGIATNKMTEDLVGCSMIGFFGFKSLNAIVEDLKENLHRTQVANDKKAAVVKEHSTGFSTVAADAAELAARFEPKAMDQSSVVDLF